MDKSRPQQNRVRRAPLRSLGRRLRNYFLTGIIIAGPIGITMWLAVQIVDFVDAAAGVLLPALPPEYSPIGVPGVGLLVFAIGLTLIGFLTANIVGTSLIRLGERLVERMPVVRSIYSALKQIFQTVLSQSSRSFREVVLVEYPRKGVWTLGFVTGEPQGAIKAALQGELISVFVPTTPNPTSGFLLFMPRSETIPVAVGVEDALKMVVSTGLVAPGATNAPLAAPEAGRPQALAPLGQPERRY